MSLDRLWNGWRSSYVRGEAAGDRSEPGSSVFTKILASGLPDEDTHIVHRGRECFVILNSFPYSTGHMLVLPYREVSNLTDLGADETAELWSTVTRATEVVKRSHGPDALNVGINLGGAAGGSIAQHLHVHIVPRWDGDANFMTAVAETRTLPESLTDTAARIRAAWN